LLRAHNAALSLAPFGTYSSPRLRLHSVAAFFFPFFLLGKCSLGQAVEKEINKWFPQLKIQRHEQYCTISEGRTGLHQHDHFFPFIILI
jgi:hypothetical protein